MHTARSLIVSPYLVVSNACPPSPHMPPLHHTCPPFHHTCPPLPHMSPLCHACAPLPPPSNHTCLLATMHPQQPRMPSRQTCTSLSNHASPPATMHTPAPWQPCMPPPRNLAPPANTHAPPCEQNQTRLWKHNLAPTLRAVAMSNYIETRIHPSTLLLVLQPHLYIENPPPIVKFPNSNCNRNSYPVNIHSTTKKCWIMALCRSLATHISMFTYKYRCDGASSSSLRSCFYTIDKMCLHKSRTRLDPFVPFQSSGIV